ncbi:MAG: ABC transporter substrate-binding protein [Spirochaetes bacterium]|nr:ABC transporter substrate-binding protein [Spirochaetota bacterium]
MKKLFLFSALIIALAVVIGCSKKKAENEILVGVVHAQTGMYAAFGQGGTFGIKAAVDDINKLGGVKVGDVKKSIRLVIVDNESDPNKAGSLAENLIVEDKVDFIVSGDEPPPMHASVSQVADKYKVPYITCVGPEEPWLGMRQETPTKWKYTWATGLFAIVSPVAKGDFRNKPGYTIMDTWTAMLDLFGSKTNKKIGIICSDDPDGRGWYTLFGPSLKKLGYTVVGLEKNLGLIPLETTDFSSAIKEWKDAGIDILWGNNPGPFFGAVWKQANTLGLKPKMVCIGRGALYFSDISAWGGDLPLGVCTEVWWDPSFKNSPGIGETTPVSLAERWEKEMKEPLNRAIGPGYRTIQVLIDAVERAGSVEGDKINEALAKTDLMTICHRVKFNENHFNRGPLVFGQWFKTDKPEKWELKVIFSKHNFATATGKAVFPKPY